MTGHWTINDAWRVGRQVGRTIYDGDDNLMGVMDTPDLAARVVNAVNQVAAAHATGDDPS